jgi:hypothetical protein
MSFEQVAIPFWSDMNAWRTSHSSVSWLLPGVQQMAAPEGNRFSWRLSGDCHEFTTASKNHRANSTGRGSLPPLDNVVTRCT